MGEISLDMIWNRLDGMQRELQAIREEQTHTNENIAAMARTLVSVRRDIRNFQRDIAGLKDRVTVLEVAVDEHPPTQPA
jgi:predicted  nucleic acid-binding Zn-ribbon protein